MPEPLYRTERQEPAYHLRYGWTCWPGGRAFVNLPSADIVSSIAPGWEADGLRALECQWEPAKI